MRTVTIEHGELLSIQQVLRTATSGSTSPAGFVVLQATSGRRYWSATDDLASITIAAGNDPDEYVQLITPSLLRAAIDASTPNDSLVIEQFADEDDLYVEVTVGDFTGKALLPPKFHPLANIHRRPNEVGAKAVFKAIDLSSLACAVWTAVVESECDSYVDASLVDGEITFTFGTTGETLALQSPYHGAEGAIYLRFDIRRFAHLLNYFLEEETVEVVFPKKSGGFVILKNDGYTARLEPQPALAAVACNHVVSIIKSTCGEAAAVSNDGDTYVLRRLGSEICGTLSVDTYPFTVRIHGNLLEGIKPTLELYEELNQLNLQSALLTYAVVDQSVVVQAELLIEGLQESNFIQATDEVANAITKYGETLAVVFGGSASQPPEVARWQEYADTLVTAEVRPGSVIELNGDYGVLDWDFPDDVYALTGYNPQGTDFDGLKINPKIAADVLLAGGRLVYGEIIRSAGSSPVPAVIAWGITRDEAREFGRRAGHDAIFELDEIHFRIVDCIGTRVHEQPRITGVIPLFESLYDDQL